MNGTKANLRKTILSYFRNSPLAMEHPYGEIDGMSDEELLRFVDATVDDYASDGAAHTYEVIRIDTFSQAKPYESYAPTWCIFQSEKVFEEETLRGAYHFVFCKRDDADLYEKVAFGPDYPYDNYGLSFVAMLLTKGGRVVSVTSRRNWDEDFGHYLSHAQLRVALGESLYRKTINERPLSILQISDTHNRHALLTNLPAADVIVHCGDFTDRGTEEEALDFLNWFIELPYAEKVFVVGNHDLCLWDALGIEDLPDNVHFLQDRGCTIEGVNFFGLGYNHPEKRIPPDVDVLVTHEPPIMILDESGGRHWGNLPLRDKVLEVKPKYHLFGHAHDAYGEAKQDGIIFSNGSSLDDRYQLSHKPKLLEHSNNLSEL